jgi:hypothetical protein
MDTAVIAALTDTRAFTEADIATLEKAETKHGAIVNWPEKTFHDVLAENPAAAILARQAVAVAKASAVVEQRGEAVLPTFPPYLSKGKDGKPEGYDPHDPSQYWTDPESGEMYRWDGKGRGKAVPTDRWLNGQPHRVVIVQHRRSRDGVLLPDEQGALDANSQGHDWFHHGYGVWVGNGGKLYGDVLLETRNRFKIAQSQMPRGDTPLVLRAPRVAAY